MLKIVMVNSEGHPEYTWQPSSDGQIPDGEKVGEYVAKHVPADIDDVVLLEHHYYDFDTEQFVNRPPRPSSFHHWSGTEKTWNVDKHQRQETFRPIINNIRDQLETGRVTVDGHLIDIDERAEKRMSDALELWDALGVTPLPWTLGDNTVLHVDKAQLQRFYDEGRRLRALRSLQLHTEARALKDNLDTTQEDIDAWEASYA